MRRETVEAGDTVITHETGQTIIRNQVVAKIAGLAVREVPGVHKLLPVGVGQSMVTFARNMTGAATTDLGVQVDLEGDRLQIGVRIVAAYGACLPEISDRIRQTLAQRVFEMTGLAVESVDLDVVDLHFPDEESQETTDPSTSHAGPTWLPQVSELSDPSPQAASIDALGERR